MLLFSVIQTSSFRRLHVSGDNWKIGLISRSSRVWESTLIVSVPENRSLAIASGTQLIRSLSVLTRLRDFVLHTG
jgi:hypothetical protein